jgi:hypothetical protein
LTLTNLFAQKRLRGTFGRPARIPITGLFHFEPPAAPGSPAEAARDMDMFWEEGLKNAEDELEFMGALQSDTLLDEADIDCADD